jgi:ComF family protein
MAARSKPVAGYVRCASRARDSSSERSGAPARPLGQSTVATMASAGWCFSIRDRPSSRECLQRSRIPAHMLAALARLLLDAVAPRRCAACDAVSNPSICTGCATALRALPVPAVRRMRNGSAFAGFEFVEPVRAALHRGKYGGDREALQELAAMTARRLSGPRLFSPDAIVAVPLGPRRRRRRGYNQAAVIAAVIAEARDVPMLEALERSRDTRPQTARDEATRRGNVAGAFKWTGTPLDGAYLWLVDDVLTTGATAGAAAAVLAQAGASLVDVVVVAAVS